MFNTSYSGPKYFSYFCNFTNKISIQGNPVTYELFSLNPETFNTVPDEHEVKLFQDLMHLTTARKAVHSYKPCPTKRPYKDRHGNSAAGPSKPKFNKSLSASPAATIVKKKSTLPKPGASGVTMAIYDDEDIVMETTPMVSNTATPATTSNIPTEGNHTE
jgi:hypothetical protein